MRMLVEAGPFAYLTLRLFVVPGLVMGALALALNKVRGLRIAAWVAAFLPLASGLAGWALGVARTDAGVVTADAAYQAELLATGHREAFQNIWIAVAAVAPLVAIALLATVLSRRSKR